MLGWPVENKLWNNWTDSSELPYNFAVLHLICSEPAPGMSRKWVWQEWLDRQQFQFLAEFHLVFNNWARRLLAIHSQFHCMYRKKCITFHYQVGMNTKEKTNEIYFLRNIHDIWKSAMKSRLCFIKCLTSDVDDWDRCHLGLDKKHCVRCPDWPLPNFLSLSLRNVPLMKGGV